MYGRGMRPSGLAGWLLTLKRGGKRGRWQDCVGNVEAMMAYRLEDILDGDCNIEREELVIIQ